MERESVFSGQEGSIEDIFYRVEKFNWAEEVEEAMEMDSLDADAPDCLSKILLENSSTKSTPLPLLGRTGSARKGRRGHGSCRKQHPDPPEAHEGSGKGKKRQPSVQGHTSKGGKPAKSAAKSDPRDPGNRHGHGDKPPYRAGRGQSRGIGQHLVGRLNRWVRLSVKECFPRALRSIERALGSGGGDSTGLMLVCLIRCAKAIRSARCVRVLDA